MKERNAVADLAIDVINLIDDVTQIKEKTLNFPFHSFTLMFVDGGGTHLIRYTDIFEESKSAVIHQLNKILQFPQNYFHVNVFVTTVEPPEHDRTYALGKIKFLSSKIIFCGINQNGKNSYNVRRGMLQKLFSCNAVSCFRR